MHSEIESERAYWNDFAEEYAEIQEESQIPIQEDVKKFLMEGQIFPAKTFLDIAGGTGKYVSSMIAQTKTYFLVDFSREMIRLAKKKNPFKNLLLIEAEQEAFLQQMPNRAFEVVFTAMNPALTNQKLLADLIRVADKYVCILRMIKDEDTVFSSIERSLGISEEQKSWMDEYKQWLKGSYQSKVFRYERQEKISRSFFEECFAEELSSEVLAEWTERIFQKEKETVSRIQIEFELLIIKR